MVERVCLGLCLLGCAAPSTDPTPIDTETAAPTPEVTPASTPSPTPSPPTPTPTPVEDTAIEPPPAWIPGAPVSCTSPDERGTLGPFEVLSTSVPGAPVNWVHGAGAALADLDGDGSLEILQATVYTVWEHRLQTDGTFQRRVLVDHAPLIATSGGYFGAYPIDYDGDGDLDVYATSQGELNHLLQNDGSGNFVDVASAAGIAGPDGHMSAGAAWADIDGDGDLDCFVAGYGHHNTGEPISTWDDGDPSLLFVNRGDGTFEDASDRLPAATAEAFSFGGGWEDFDLDGDLDLYIYQDLGALMSAGNVLVLNDGTGQFTLDTATRLDISMSAMGLGLGDLNDDGRIDLSMAGWRSQKLFISNGPTWFESSAARGVFADGSIRQDVGWGNEMADLDNDGDLDILVAYGELDITRAINQSDEPDALYLQGPTGAFSDEAAAWGFDDQGVSRSLALGDLNRDGWLDVAKTGPQGDLLVYQSRCGDEAWVEIELQGPGANPYGVGAMVVVEGAGSAQQRRLYAGSTGFASSSEPIVHVGLGSSVIIQRVEVTWPDGLVQEIRGVDVRQRIRILHPSSHP